MWAGKKVLAVVPARGGSKGIPRKNLAEVGGLSLVARAARIARALDWVDRAVLSTDDAEIAAEGMRHGLEVPFMRPADLADDTATGAAAWRHAWLACEAHFGERYDYAVLLQPTSPFRTVDHVARTLKAMVDGGHAAAATISPVPGHFAPQKIFTHSADGTLQYFHEDGPRHSNRQTIPNYWTRNGLCYAVTRDTLVGKGQIVEHDCVGVIIEGQVVNIDDPDDLMIARLLADHGGYE